MPSGRRWRRRWWGGWRFERGYKQVATERFRSSHLQHTKTHPEIHRIRPYVLRVHEEIYHFRFTDSPPVERVVNSIGACHILPIYVRKSDRVVAKRVHVSETLEDGRILSLQHFGDSFAHEIHLTENGPLLVASSNRARIDPNQTHLLQFDHRNIVLECIQYPEYPQPFLIFGGSSNSQFSSCECLHIMNLQRNRHHSSPNGKRCLTLFSKKATFF